MLPQSVVWLSDEGYACRIFVDSFDLARQITLRLSREFIFKTSEPIQQGGTPTICSFRVAYGPTASHRRLAALLATMPDIRIGSGSSGTEAN